MPRSKMLGFLKSVLYHAPKTLKLIAYRYLIRTILEHGCQVWDLYKKCEIEQIEEIQGKTNIYMQC